MEMYDSLIDIVSLPIPIVPTDVQSKVPAWLQKWGPIWESLWKNLLAFGETEKAKEVNIFGYVVWRLGWECGTLLRRLQGKGISWGTYKDKMGTHCNAHANNMVVIAPHSPSTNSNGSNTSFLAPLDFDMAFASEDLLPDIAGQSMEEIFHVEKRGMAIALAGDEQINTGVMNTSTTGLTPEQTMLKWGLRDTLVKAFFSAYGGEEDLHPFDPSLRDIANDLIQLALVVTSNIVV